MQPNPFTSLLKSRKFWLLILDLVVSLALYFGGKYLGPDLFSDMKFLIGTMQPVFAFIIVAIAYEDAARMKAEALMAPLLPEEEPYSGLAKD